MTTITATLSKAGATGYYVKNYYGTTVSSGSISGTTVTPTAPVGGWLPGWYRLYLTGASTDTLYGASYGAANFLVVRSTSGYPANSAAISPNAGGEDRDVIAKGVLGLGVSRLQIASAQLVDPLNPTAGGGDDTLAACRADAANLLAYVRTDTARPRPLLLQFPTRTADYLTLATKTTGSLVRVYVKDGIVNGANVYIASADGSVSGSKLTVSYPNNSTVVETYDNLASGAAAAAAINGVSAYIVAFDYGGSTVAATSATAIGATYRAGVAAAVTDLYPRGVTRYEGPSNEPDLNAETAHQMRLFQAAVHAGNASAKAVGPCAINLDPASWATFLAVGGAYCDELSTHAYNSATNGDPNLARYSFDRWREKVVAAGYGTLPVWITESTHAFLAVYGVHHPRRARVPVWQIIQAEQYGCPKEQNILWYDRSHGFWGYPSWWENADGSLGPQAAALRVMDEELHGMPFDHPLDFGSVQGNAIYLGNLYTNTSTGESVAAVIAPCYIPSAQVIVKLTGTVPASLTVVDGFGNLSTVTVTSTRATVPVGELPTYIRLPAGVTMVVDSCNDWGATPPPTISPAAIGTIGGASSPVVGDNGYMTAYTGGAGVGTGIYHSSVGMPDSAKLVWNATVAVDRILVWCGPVWQSASALVDFDVQTTTDNVSWTTRLTVTKTTPSSFVHGTDDNNVGCTYETYWDEQWIFDVKLPASYNCTGVRVWARATSYGGEPEARNGSGGYGQGDDTQYLTIQEIAVPSLSTPPLYTNAYATEVLADSPNGYWRVGEPSGTSAVDSSGNSNTGTYVNTPTLGLAGALADGNTAIAQASGGYITVPHAASLNVADTFTFEFWAKGIAASGRNYVTGKGTGSGAPFIVFEDGHLKLIEFPTGFSTPIATSSSAVPDTLWHHWAVTKNGATTHIYLDGVEGTTAGTNKTFSNNTAALHLGASDIDVGVNASWDEFAYYPTVLSAGRILTHYQAAPTPTSAPATVLAPVITGTVKVGRQLQASTGTWTVPPSALTYQWQKSSDDSTGWADIAAAALSPYTVAAGESGKYFRCRVVGTNGNGSSTATASNVLGPAAS